VTAIEAPAPKINLRSCPEFAAKRGLRAWNFHGHVTAHQSVRFIFTRPSQFGAPNSTTAGASRAADKNNHVGLVMVRGSAFALGVLAFATLAGSDRAAADATYQTLYSFTGGSDGARPRSGLVMDAAGNLYGTTPMGGTSNLGTLFRLAPDGTFTLLHGFAGGRDGAVPTAAALTLDSHGTIYGMTEQGGVANGGTAYRFRNGKITILHSFGVGEDSYWPQSGLLMQPDGSLVGTASAGGGAGCPYYGCGTIFRLAPDGTETILHAFAGDSSDGAGPTGTPVRDRMGNLYGTTWTGGGHNEGTVYKVAPDGTESILYNFADTASYPYQGLAIDRRGNLFGTTVRTFNEFAGTVFEIDARGRESNVLSFLNGPGYGTGLTGLLTDRRGNLYGTLAEGGGNQTGDCTDAGGCGAFFVITPDRQITVLHGFGGTDGEIPYGSVITDGRGNFFGTTMSDGRNNDGTIFRISMGTK
jgi:uncharacterized repeat protein (TIGR03803 family)